jgi:hypothetical protein
MKMRSDLLFSVTLAVAATSGALAQASHRQLRFRKRRSNPLLQGRQETFGDCMGYWEPATHMSKSEWRQACRCTLNGTDLVPPRSGAKGN